MKTKKYVLFNPRTGTEYEVLNSRESARELKIWLKKNYEIDAEIREQ